MATAELPAHLIVVFGGTGDLARKKLLPALFNLATQNLLGERWRILAVSRRRGPSDEGYRAWVATALADEGISKPQLAQWCAQTLHHASIGEGAPGDFQALAARIEGLEAEAQLPGNRIFYLALPSAAYAETIQGLGQAGLQRGPGFTRVVVEKPFGYDTDSAQVLNASMHEYFQEDQIYRIDHYLGKETVQNLLVFRFGNSIFEDLWNRDRIESVQITVAETIGVGERAAFYEKTGAVRDIIQNHLTQLLCLTAMEVPAAFDAESVRYEKVKVLRAIRPIAQDDIVFAQYASAPKGQGDSPRGYLEEEGVAVGSRTETFAAMRLVIDNWRWQGVPFYIRTGKRLAKKTTQIAVAFRSPPVCLFESMGACLLHRNVLLITLQPDEGFSFQIDVKAPGEPLALQNVPLEFKYSDAFGELPDAYETLLLDVLQGDQTLFVHAAEVEASWRLFDPVLQGEPAIQPYAVGSMGPSEASWLLGRDGQRWLSD
jgi:glucose-6-phosphate 1-dehydrogenase